MSNGSPTAFLVWSLLSCLFLCFLFYHLWSYDKFQCLKWDAGRQPGAFRRVMTYSYLMTVPLLVVFSVGLTVLKFEEGFLAPLPPLYEIHPKPVHLWTTNHQHILLALYFVFSVAWALELVTHFEELAFWLFLLDQGPSKREWFSSWEYRFWYTGCIAAILGMPLTALITRNELETMDAWLFLIGSAGATATNVAFIYVLIKFPAFLRHVKAEGAEPDVVVRLSSFYEYNLLRVFFRFMSALPFLALAIDGIMGTHPINGSLFWADFLLVLAANGQFISSAITLMIFFPRSFTTEAGYRTKAPSSVPGSARSYITQNYTQHHPDTTFDPASPSIISSPKSPRQRAAEAQASQAPDVIFVHRHPHSARSSEENVVDDVAPTTESEEPAPGYHEREQGSVRYSYPYAAPSPYVHPEPPRVLRRESISRFGRTSVAMVPRGTGMHVATRRFSAPTLHPYVVTFTSPIDLIQIPRDSVPHHAP